MSEWRYFLAQNRGTLLAIAFFVVMFAIYTSNHPAGFTANVVQTAATDGSAARQKLQVRARGYALTGASVMPAFLTIVQAWSGGRQRLSCACMVLRPV